MTYEIDPSAPLASLKSNGFNYKHVSTTDTTTYNFAGMKVVDIADGDRLDFTLPKKCGFKVVFTKEKLSTQFSKLFKGELQIGDPEFDDAVFILTDDEEKVAKLLQSDRVRATIRGVIILGGTIGV